MSDIYVRPYDSGTKTPGKGLLPVILILAVLGGITWWMIRRPKTKAEETVVAPVEQSTEVLSSTSQAPSVVKPSISSASAEKLFTRARSLISSGKPAEASQLLGEVIATTTDTNLKNNALRMQGRVNVDLFLSEAPTADKKTYIIQPGDSLDRIARNNNTTVDLLRRINGIEGNLIFPGARLLVPVAPFVLEVDKSDRTMTLMINGNRLKRYSVGLGRGGKTPLGTFTTVVHQTNPDWSPPSGGIVPFGDPLNVLGTRWISIADESHPDIKGFGIHGTTDRESIGGETSNGCIRMLNEDVEEVFLLIPRGTHVIISE